MRTKARINPFPYLLLGLLGAAGLLLNPSAHAQSALDTFMHIEGIPSESNACCPEI